MMKLFQLIIIIINLYMIVKTNNYKEMKYKNYINIAYAFDKNYHYITHVSMKSIMLSQKNETFINFFMLVSNITDEQKTVINKISEEHKNCKIIFFDMGNHFKEFKITVNFWSTADFYRLKLVELLKGYKKVLYLDTDTIIYKDLTKLYNNDISGKYFIGMPEPKGKGWFINHNISFNNFINTGVLLCNLEELKKDNILDKITEYIRNNINNLTYLVNDPTNIISHKKNGIFDPEFVVVGFCNEEDAFNYYSYYKIKINKTLVVKAYKNPYILHYINYIKPWRGIPNKKGLVCFDSISRFYEAARKTSYYYDILKMFPVTI